jgi:branched-chain amino acid transport system substrate-binding protein
MMVNSNCLLTQIVFIVAAILGVASIAQAEEHTLKIGFVLPLSGEWAKLGNGIRDAAALAKADLAKQQRRIELVFQDNRGDVAESAGIAKQLVTIDRVDAMVSIISGVGQVLKPIANEAQVLHVGICSNPEVADGKFSFINYLTAEQGVAKFLSYLREKDLSGQSLGIFAMNEAGFLKIVEELKSKSAGIAEIRFVETYDKGMSDFKSLIMRMRKEDADIYMLLGMSPEIELLALQIRGLGDLTPLTSIESFGLATTKIPFNGSEYVDSPRPPADFAQRFKTTYGHEITPGVGQAYDTVMMIASPAADEKKLPEKFREIQSYAGLLGIHNVGSDGIIVNEPVVYRIENGEPTRIDE